MRECAADLGLDGWAAGEYVRRGWWGTLLSPPFVEWMMGLDAGRVTGVPGVSRNAQLRALGNGVVPPQALLAIVHLVRLLLVDRDAAPPGEVVAS